MTEISRKKFNLENPAMPVNAWKLEQTGRVAWLHMILLVNFQSKRNNLKIQ